MKMDKMLFQDENKIYTITISKNVYEEMLCHCDKANPYETGGILIGNYSDDQTTANIIQVTSAPQKSKHFKYNFYRSSKGLKEVLDSLWNKGQYYLGEWHYHPNASAEPSNVDKKQMLKLSQDKKLNCPEPILVIIGGNKDNWYINVRIYTDEKEIIIYTIAN